VKAAVIFYGAAPVREFRRDLPLLIVRAGLDRPALNILIDSLASLALSQNAPVTVLNHAGGHHAFEIVDDNAGTRAAIDQAIAFLRYAAAPRYLLAVRSALPEASAAAYMRVRDYQRAAALYGDLVAQNPADPTLGLAYGEALLGAGRFAAACDQFAKLRDKGLGPRDLGLPAARACLNKGDPRAAIEWLRTIPSRFLPPSVRTDTAFAALRDRPDFQALFQRSGPPPMP
jgi:tetratricopeptide (TPR) repeat protein